MGTAIALAMTEEEDVSAELVGGSKYTLLLTNDDPIHGVLQAKSEAQMPTEEPKREELELGRLHRDCEERRKHQLGAKEEEAGARLTVTETEDDFSSDEHRIAELLCADSTQNGADRHDARSVERAVLGAEIVDEDARDERNDGVNEMVTAGELWESRRLANTSNILPSRAFGPPPFLGNAPNQRKASLRRHRPHCQCSDPS